MAYAGIALFVLLGIYAGLLLNADRLPPRWRLPSPASLRPRLTIAFVLVATLPAISLALVLSERANRQRTERAAASLQIEADRTGRTLDFLLGTTRAGVAALAQHIERAGALTRDAALRQLQLHHAAAPGIESMVLVSQDGSIVAATVRTASGPVSFAGNLGNTGDNPFFRLASRSGVPQISGAEREPLLRRGPAILISAPVRAPERRCVGSGPGRARPGKPRRPAGSLRR